MRTFMSGSWRSHLPGVHVHVVCGGGREGGEREGGREGGRGGDGGMGGERKGGGEGGRKGRGEGIRVVEMRWERKNYGRK